MAQSQITLLALTFRRNHQSSSNLYQILLVIVVSCCINFVEIHLVLFDSQPILDFGFFYCFSYYSFTIHLPGVIFRQVISIIGKNISTNYFQNLRYVYIYILLIFGHYIGAVRCINLKLISHLPYKGIYLSCKSHFERRCISHFIAFLHRACVQYGVSFCNFVHTLI